MAETDKALIGPTNVLARDGVTIDESTASSYIPSGLPLTNVVDVEPSTLGRITRLDPWLTFFDFTLDAAFDVGLFAGVNHDWPEGSQVRFTRGSFTVERLFPDSELNNGFTIGDYTDFDDDPINFDSGGDKSSGAASQNSTFGFENPAVNPVAGEDLQSFVMVVEHDPQEEIRAYFDWAVQDGATTIASGTAYLGFLGDSGGAQYLVIPWDAADLVTADGSGVRLSITVGANSGTLDIHAVGWDCVQSSPTEDTGWVTLGSAVAVPDSDDPRPQKSFHVIPDATWEDADEVVMWVRACMPVETAAGTGDIPKAFLSRNTYMSIGVVYAGTIRRYNIRRGSLSFQPVINRRGGSTDAGQSYGADAFVMREAGATFLLTRSELHELIDLIDWRKGHARPFYVAMEPGLNLSKQLFTAFWANLRRGGEPRVIGVYSDGDAQMWARQMAFIERL